MKRYLTHCPVLHNMEIIPSSMILNTGIDQPVQLSNIQRPEIHEISHIHQVIVGVEIMRVLRVLQRPFSVFERRKIQPIRNKFANVYRVPQISGIRQFVVGPFLFDSYPIHDDGARQQQRVSAFFRGPWEIVVFLLRNFDGILFDEKIRKKATKKYRVLYEFDLKSKLSKSLI